MQTKELKIFSFNGQEISIAEALTLDEQYLHILKESAEQIAERNRICKEDAEATELLLATIEQVKAAREELARLRRDCEEFGARWEREVASFDAQNRKWLTQWIAKEKALFQQEQQQQQQRNLRAKNQPSDKMSVLSMQRDLSKFSDLSMPMLRHASNSRVSALG